MIKHTNDRIQLEEYVGADGELAGIASAVVSADLSGQSPGIICTWAEDCVVIFRR